MIKNSFYFDLPSFWIKNVDIMPGKIKPASLFGRFKQQHQTI